MLQQELHKKVKYLQLKASHLVNDVLSGEYQSSFRGRGMEFDEVREYQPGDDVRAIDWNVTARTGQPHIKVFREEREMTITVILDISRSQSFQSSKRGKLDVAAEVAAIFAYLAIRNNDKVGLILFSEGVDLHIPPRKGRQHIWNIIQTALTTQPRGQGTSLETAVKHFLQISKRRQLVAVISDFIVPSDDLTILKQLGRRHDTIALHIEDPNEASIPDAGLVAMRDSETQALTVVDTSSPAWRKKAQASNLEAWRQRTEVFKQSGVDFVSISTGEAPITRLQQLFMDRTQTQRKRR
ncbi:MAG: DUF58 domain-containing protein [Pseudobacteriovorax sp.]|nr:DUF58 domain-containing protein [Pseudobacteriovorax sp.]